MGDGVPQQAELLGVAHLAQRGERRGVVAGRDGQRRHASLQARLDGGVPRGGVGVGVERALAQQRRDAALAARAQAGEVGAAAQHARGGRDRSGPAGRLGGARERRERRVERGVRGGAAAEPVEDGGKTSFTPHSLGPAGAAPDGLT